MSNYDLKHALNVAGRVDGLEAKMTALLHDAVEDGACTEQDLWDAEIPEAVVKAVQILTRNPDIAYIEYIEYIKNSRNTLAIAVKLADLDANLSRMDSEHASLTGRYRNASQRLSSSL